MVTAEERVKRVFRKHGGTMRTREIQAEGVHTRTLYALRDAGLRVLRAAGERHACLSTLRASRHVVEAIGKKPPCLWGRGRGLKKVLDLGRKDSPSYSSTR